MDEQPNYYSIIPSTVRYDEKISPNAKLLYGEITALCNKQGFCWATNKYFADIYKTTVRTIQRWIEQLNQEGYIIVNYDYKEGTNSIDGRCISIVDITTKLSWDSDKTIMGARQNCHGGSDISVMPYPYYNNKTNNTINNSAKVVQIAPNDKFDKEVHFDIFWKEYPSKINKKKAKDKFFKICNDEEIFNSIMDGLRKYKQTPQWEKDNGEFIPHPTTWLNGERWNDEIEVKESGECEECYTEDEHGNKFDQFGNRIYK